MKDIPVFFYILCPACIINIIYNFKVILKLTDSFGFHPFGIPGGTAHFMGRAQDRMKMMGRGLPGLKKLRNYRSNF